MPGSPARFPRVAIVGRPGTPDLAAPLRRLDEFLASRGHAVVLERLALRPLLELDLRLGEGTGAALAMSLVDAAVAVRDGMATFDAAGVSGPAGTRGPVA